MKQWYRQRNAKECRAATSGNLLAGRPWLELSYVACTNEVIGYCHPGTEARIMQKRTIENSAGAQVAPESTRATGPRSPRPLVSLPHGFARHFRAFGLLAMLALFNCDARAKTDPVAAGFREPPPAARPWVYWFIMDGNLTREGITADFEAMRQAGIGGMVMMEVEAGIPRGPVEFMSREWQELFAHAVREAERLGLEITLNAGPGWTGSGGPWVKPEQSMQHLVASATAVRGPKRFSEALPRPERRPAFFGDGKLPKALEQAKDDFYVDVVVLAFPTPAGDQRISDIDEKALYVRAPYSSQPGVKPFLPTQATYPTTPAGGAIDPGSIVDLTDKLGAEGRLSWDVPEGDWTILRFGRTSTGANTRPAPMAGVGLECDKFDRGALDAHFDTFVGALLRKVGSRTRRNGGWTSLHIDSWEMGAQNWTAAFREQFRARRGYDPKPYLPSMTGRVVGSTEISERFLWDLRQTAQELVVENHAEHLKALGRRHGLGLSIEPYDMNPCADLSLGAVADVPMCEFWLHGFNTTYSVLEAASIAHTRGKPIVAAEAFTSSDAERWQAYPGSMKALGDWAFSSGVNRIVFHRYQHQPALDRWPGMTMGPYGVHWERTQTWWNMASAYHAYLARCQFLLRKGLPVADVCFLAAEGAPQVFRPPRSAVRGSPPDHLGYSFDAITPETLISSSRVSKGRLVLPHGVSYRVLVLPESPTMTPQLLRKIEHLVQAGATVIGPRPDKSPSLSGYPACDTEVSRMAANIWGNCDGQDRREHRLSRGRVLWQKARPETPGQPLANARWIWYPEGSPAGEAPLGERFFRRSFNLADAGSVDSAHLAITADNSFKARMNGKEIGEGDNFTLIYSFDVTEWLVSGTNLLTVTASNVGDAANPAGLIAKLLVRLRDGNTVEIVTDSGWEAALAVIDTNSVPASQKPWTEAIDLGPLQMAPWGNRVKDPEADQYGDFSLVEQTLKAMGIAPDFESDQSLRYIHRRDGETDFYFVANSAAQNVGANCSFRVTGRRPELWDPVTGQVRDLADFRVERERTVMPLHFAPRQSSFVVFRKKGKAPTGTPANFPDTRRVLDLKGPWELSFDPRWGGPKQITFPALEDWSMRSEPGIKFYSGVATYRKTFDFPGSSARSSRTFVDLGVVKNLARVRLNGTDLGVIWCAPWRVDITDVVKPAGNKLEVEVANLWPNRLIGDAALPEDQRLTSTTWNPFKAGTPLLESGLIGPVTLVVAAEERR